MTDPLQRIEDLSPEQRDLLLRRLARLERKTPDRPSQLSALRRFSDGPVPLSFAQERAWFLDTLAPGDPSRNITGVLRLHGRLSRPALARTLDEILRRHETLRARFRAADGKPAQVIRPADAVPVPVVDLSRLAAGPRSRERQRLCRREVRRGFDLVHDRLFRATLLHLGHEEHLLLLAMHHIASDGWSIGVLAQEFSTLYAAFARSRPSALDDLPIRYGDFAAWQRQRLQGGALDRGLAYWRRQLADPPPILELPPDRVPTSRRPSLRRGQPGATCFLELGSELKRDLEELSRRHDTTLFVTLLTAFMVLLMRCTGQRDVLIGSPVSGRTRVETEGLIGLFLNTLVVRVRLSRELTFRRAVAAVRQTVLAGLEFAEVPFERVVQELDPERSAAGHPLFETVFNFTPGQRRRLDLPDLQVEVEEPPGMGAQFAMEVFVTEWEGSFELKLLYPKERYSESHMVSFLDQLEAVLRQVAGDAERRIGSLDLATPQSRRLLPDPFIALRAPAQRPVPHRIADRIRQTPDQPAIRQGGTTLTYAALGAGMTAIAESLRARGLQPGQVVAVAGRRAPGVAVCMSGCLLSAGVLLTLSPDLPERRQRLMLEQADARFLLRVGEPRAEDAWLGELRGIEIIEVSAAGLPAAARLDRSPIDVPGDAPVRSGGSEPAYVFFTSGSTGRPKGVLGTHAGLAQFLHWQSRTFGVGPGDRSGQLTGLSFDVVLRDVFLPLTSGATLVLPQDADVVSGAATLGWLDRERISILHTVPTLVETWLQDRPDGVTLADLRRIFFAGEPLTSTLVERWRDAFPRAGEIVNLYGPTETTLAKCYYRVPARAAAGIQPLGRAIPRAQALVLTPERRLCGLYEPGEIAVRTPFRSLGYLNAAAEGARSFIADPWSRVPGERLYLTGDRGVYDADGRLRFHGRIDHQLKVRGVRAEPAEIAAALEASSDVAACAVVARRDGRDGTLLVAYVVAAPGGARNTSRLQAFLRRRLPPALVPASFVFLDTLPLTTNQKLDRDRLPAPDGMRPDLKSSYLAPRDATELRLVQIWEELLDVRPIGVSDSFFELGGHSLLALHLLVQIEQDLGLKVPLPALFEDPTIAHLAAVARQQADEWPRVVSLWSAQHRLGLFLVHPGGGILWNYVHLVRHLAAEVPIYGLQARGLDARSEPHRDLEQMAADYVAEIRRLQPAGPYLLAGHSLGGMVAFEMARQLDRAGQEIALLAMFDSALPRAAGPHRRVADERLEDARSLADMAAVIERFMGREVGIAYEALCDLSTDEQIEFVVEALSRGDAFPYPGGRELTRNLLNVSKAHVLARRAYRARTSPVPVTLFRARDARPHDPASPGVDADHQETLGWGAVAEDVRVLWSPGDHVTMMSEPYVEQLARALKSCLTAVLPSPEA